ncbi:PD-(D/E)XK nuclease family protein [Facklamia languida]|uniref:Uncharacterized protein n=1 Tax=Facklamia languida CCUG 37842 TaxID=883113 RepID=H3NKV2_9LACT|nr:PD-(D/E)XK nuclease family protein [Facklamia languida]EHR36230.1 hypothetical protein HMPREF9708_01491 [Facklamia languida CCUG 37842]
MPIQLITGDLAVDKKPVIVAQLLDLLRQDPSRQVYYIVPDHIKFEMESYILDTMRQAKQGGGASQETNPSVALFNLQVASFSRLNWFLSDGPAVKQDLSDLGLAMIVRQILRTHQDQLYVYKKQVRYQAFAEDLVALFKELIQGNIEPEDLVEEDLPRLEEAVLQDPKRLDQRRIKEVQVLYQAFLEALEGQSVANFSRHDQLIDQVRHSHLAKHYFVIDHHYYLTSQEWDLVINLAKASEGVWLTLPVSAADLKAQRKLPLNELAYETAQRAQQIAAQAQVPMLEPWEISQPAIHQHPDLARLAQAFQVSQNTYQLPAAGHELALDPDRCVFLEFDSVQNELTQVANRIHQLVTEEGYRYRDIRVMTRHMDRYQAIIDPIFKANAIPYFFDHARSMSDHPLFSLIQALRQLAAYHWPMESILQVVKSPLMAGLFHQQVPVLDPSDLDHALFLFENVVIANRYQGHRFYDLDLAWYFMSQDLAYVDHLGQSQDMTNQAVVVAIRQALVEALAPFIQKHQTKNLGQVWAKAFYQLLDQVGVLDQMKAWRDTAIAAGQISESRQHEQVWQVLMDCLDEFQLVYGQTAIRLDDFLEVLLAGLESGTYHIIPPTLDQVTFTNLVSPQVSPAKVTFVVGLDQQALPQKPADLPILTAANRQDLMARLKAEGDASAESRPKDVKGTGQVTETDQDVGSLDQEAGPVANLAESSSATGSRHKFLLDQASVSRGADQVYAYQLVLSARDYLYLSYAQVYDQVKLSPSPYLQQLVRLVDYDFISQPQWLGKYALMVSPTLQTLHTAYVQQEPVSQSLIERLAIYQAYPVLDLVEESFNFIRLPDKLDPDLSLALYGRDLNLSVSRVEQYYQDPFSHFLLYGLRLQEREEGQIDPATAGDYYHQVLDQVFTLQKERGLDLARLDVATWQDLVNQVLTQVGQLDQFQVFNQSPRFQAIRRQMQGRMHAFGHFLLRQAQQNPFQVLHTEVTFGGARGQGLQGFTYPLASKGHLTIRGKIDRIDGLVHQDQAYLQVIDYKSGQKNFNLVDAYYGLDLQVLTYLAVAHQHYPDHRLVGGFYQPILHKYETGKDLDWTGSASLQEDAYLRRNRLKGFVNQPAEVLSDLEVRQDAKGQSLIYPVTYTKSGYHKGYTLYFDDQDLATLLAYTHHKFVEAANRIQAGDIELAPYHKDRYTTSINRKFRVITGFDATQADNYQRYRHKTLDKDQVLTTMAEDLKDRRQAGKEANQ